MDEDFMVLCQDITSENRCGRASCKKRKRTNLVGEGREAATKSGDLIEVALFEERSCEENSKRAQEIYFA